MDLKGKPGEYIWDDDEAQYVGRNRFDGNEDRRFVAQGDSSFMNGVAKVVSGWRPSNPHQFAQQLGPTGSNDYLLRGYGLILDLFTLTVDHWVVTAARILNTDSCGLIELITEISKAPEAEREAKLEAIRKLFDKEITRRNIRKYSYLTKAELSLQEHRKQVASKRKLAKDFEKRLKAIKQRYSNDKEDKSSLRAISSIAHKLMGYYGTASTFDSEKQFRALYSFRMPYGDTSLSYAKIMAEWEAYCQHNKITSSPISVFLKYLDPEDLEALLIEGERLVVSRLKQNEAQAWDIALSQLDNDYEVYRHELMEKCPHQWRSDLNLLKEWQDRNPFDNRIDGHTLINEYLQQFTDYRGGTSYPQKPTTFYEFILSNLSHSTHVKGYGTHIWIELDRLYKTTGDGQRFDLPSK